MNFSKISCIIHFIGYIKDILCVSQNNIKMNSFSLGAGTVLEAWYYFKKHFYLSEIIDLDGKIMFFPIWLHFILRLIYPEMF